MADYVNWVVGGLIPVVVMDNAKIDLKSRTITLNCFAARELMNEADPEEEIERFNQIAARAITNTTTYNAGSNLQVASNDHIFSVTNGKQVWDRCALQKILTQYGYFYKISGLYFTLVIEYEEMVGGGFSVYEPSYHDTTKYPNVEHYTDTSKAFVPSWDTAQGGTELGWMKIIEQQPVKQVLLYGSACELPASITVEGSIEGTQQWSVSHEGRESEVYEGRGVQLLTFNMITPIMDIVIYTSPHLFYPTQTIENNHGAWLLWIKNVFGE